MMAVLSRGGPQDGSGKAGADAADQREQGGALGSGKWLGVSEQGPSPRLFSLILCFAN